MESKFLKNYIYVNITFLLLALYVIFFPFISNFLADIVGINLKCPYKEITNTPCPLCGGTRYIANISKVFSDINYLFCPFGYITLFVIFEVIFRIVIIFRYKNIKKLKELAIFDFYLHILAFIIFMYYIISYSINLY